MDVAKLFLQRHDVLYDFWLAGVWEDVPEKSMRQRPHPLINSIAWNVWHLARAEDAAMNRFVVDRPQVLDHGRWMDRMDLPWRHNGFGMTLAEVDDLSRRIDLQGLRGYSNGVRNRTREIVRDLDPETLDAGLDLGRVRAALFDEGLAHTQAAELLETYSAWTRGNCLMNLGLTHSFQHVGQIGVIAKLLGVEFE